MRRNVAIVLIWSRFCFHLRNGGNQFGSLMKWHYPVGQRIRALCCGHHRCIVALAAGSSGCFNMRRGFMYINKSWFCWFSQRHSATDKVKTVDLPNGLRPVDVSVRICAQFGQYNAATGFIFSFKSKVSVRNQADDSAEQTEHNHFALNGRLPTKEEY